MITTYFDDLKLLRGATDIDSRRYIELRDRDYWCLQYNHAGTISVKIDGRDPLFIEGPSLLITSPGHEYFFGTKDGWHHNYIAFKGPRVKRYLQSGLLPRKRDTTKIRDGHTFLNQLKNTLSLMETGEIPKACHSFEGLLLHLQQPAKPTEEPSLRGRIRSLTQDMRNQPEKNWDLQAEADRLHISLVHLRRVFKEVTRLAPGQFLLNSRLSVAAEKLSSTFLPLKQIAAEVGFENIHYFSRVFSREYGLPPGRFRREFLGE